MGLSAAAPRECTFFYNICELKHMQDVKSVTRVALSIWLVGGVLALLAAGVLYYSWDSMAALRGGVMVGAGITLAIYLGLLAYIGLNFDALFVQFHEVFFEKGTWMFLWSDSLIRMFPLRFWQDCFIFVSAASVLEALGLGWLAWRIK